MITIIGIGKKHEDWVLPGIERYQKRLKRPYSVEWVLLPHSSLQGDKARYEESERILSRLNHQNYIVLLDERGIIPSSEEFANQLETNFTGSISPTFIIGGAYGVSEALQKRANATMSLSKLVFPHQLVRLLLIEQLYRAQEISRGSAYHHA